MTNELHYANLSEEQKVLLKDLPKEKCIELVSRINSNMPISMKSLKQHVGWRYELSENGKITKVPRQSRLQKASTTNPDTWTDIEAILKIALQGDFHGIGTCFFKGDGNFGIDIDHCIDAQGDLEPWAQEIVSRFPTTYIERSPSARGLHILGKGKTLATGSKKWKDATSGENKGIEVYDYKSPRYLTFTGDIYQTGELTESESGLIWIYETFYLERLKSTVRTKAFPLDETALREALKFLDPDDYDIWLKTALATKFDGFPPDIFHEFASRSPKYDFNENQKKWDSLNPTGIGVGHLFKLASANGYRSNVGKASPEKQLEQDSFELETIGAADLMKVEFPEVKWAVEGLLSEGLNICAGASKIGKSFLAFSLAIDVSLGRKALGFFPTTQGKVLYLALEDHRRRLQERFKKLSAENCELASNNLRLCTKFPRMDEGGMDALIRWCKQHSDCKLIVSVRCVA